jgi:hypothetical protein
VPATEAASATRAHTSGFWVCAPPTPQETRWVRVRVRWRVLRVACRMLRAAMYLVALLRVVGVPAEGGELGVGEGGHVDSSVPVLGLFLHLLGGQIQIALHVQHVHDTHTTHTTHNMQSWWLAYAWLTSCWNSMPGWYAARDCSHCRAEVPSSGWRSRRCAPRSPGLWVV